mmetsp:Transcript_24551/g.68320  ORF Transcript_24551/g.68320 Transcript_24551/m.68320 type:complete len:215 (+) Transcript_24551:667-1311(+)
MRGTHAGRHSGLRPKRRTHAGLRGNLYSRRFTPSDRGGGLQLGRRSHSGSRVGLRLGRHSQVGCCIGSRRGLLCWQLYEESVSALANFGRHGAGRSLVRDDELNSIDEFLAFFITLEATQIANRLLGFRLRLLWQIRHVRVDDSSAVPRSVAGPQHRVAGVRGHFELYMLARNVDIVQYDGASAPTPNVYDLSSPKRQVRRFALMHQHETETVV